ncbi:toll-like receptor 4 [Physella acuta]|uniref:toll-like receptor 4 n=1 Tax=Physella acuta TaxID=109671 RepID=UPI0027DC0EFE|nr:toll-like receptor 4 [Physella acuta]
MLAPLNSIICSMVLLFIIISPIQSSEKETRENIHKNIRQDKKPMMSLCPFPCNCAEDINKHEFSVTCSNRGLQNIPDIPPQVTALDLQNNLISNITCYDFKELSNLKSLSLSYNKIKTLENACIFSNQAKLEMLHITYTTLTFIEPFIFSNLSQLKVLDLSRNNLIQILNNSFFGLNSLTFLSLQSNNLKYYNNTFELEAFIGLNQLEIIHLEGNNPTFDFSTYPDEALSKLTNLREIFLDGYPIQLGPGFKSLHNLETIHMNNYPPGTFCVFNYSIPNNFFENIMSLKPFSIDLNGCQLKYLPPIIFRNISNLIFLNLYNTRMLLLTGFENGSISLNDSNIKVLNLSKINIEGPYFSSVSRQLFRYLKYTPLESLDISSNRIYTVDAFAFVDLPPTLEYLSLRNNKIARFEIFIAILTLGRVKTIDASLQLQYTETPDNTNVIYDFDCEINSKHMDSNHNSNILRNRNETAGSNTRTIDQSSETFYFPLPFSLEIFSVSTLKVEYSIPAITVKNNKVLRYLDYSNNMARCWQGPIKAPPTLQHLDLSKNYCTKMSLTFFKYLTNLTTLLLHDNVLGPTLANDISGIAFSTLTRLETLNISGNTITTLSRNIFQNSINLKYLNLSRNSLTHFEVDLNGVLKLEELDLNKNLLSGFSEKNCEDLKQLKSRNSKFKIRIQSNPLMCTCEYLSFVHLLITQSDIFDSVDSITCTTIDGSNLSHDQLATFYPQLMKSCVSQ